MGWNRIIMVLNSFLQWTLIRISVTSMAIQIEGRGQFPDVFQVLIYCFQQLIYEEYPILMYLIFLCPCKAPSNFDFVLLFLLLTQILIPFLLILEEFNPLINIRFQWINEYDGLIPSCHKIRAISGVLSC